ncbi:TPA: hypothetical protein SEA38_001706 [Campylobacter fetus]|nr:hypothetical protein [Campylobacter fetus]
MNKIYIYPNNEDAFYAKYMLTELIDEYGLKAEFISILDDNIPGHEISKISPNKNSFILISCFDKVLFKKLFDNAKGFKRYDFTTFISSFFNKILNLNELNDINYLLKSSVLRLALFFISFFKNRSNAYKMLNANLENLVSKLSSYYIKMLGEKPDVIYFLSSFANSKHLGNIDKFMKQNGLKIAYFVDENDASGGGMFKNLNPIIAPFYYMLNTNICKIFISTHTVCMSLKSSHKKLIVPHAFIYPIASLAQRKRPLDEHFFNKLARNNNLIVCASTKSNYKILKTAFKNRCLKAGYPMFDLLPNLNSKTQDPKNKILLAINNTEFLYTFKVQVEKLLNKFQVILRPHPAQIFDKEFLNLKKELENHPNFFYDDNKNVVNPLTNSTFCCFSDTSSLSYTYAITFKNPVILCVQQTQKYEDISFFDKRLHILYNGDMVKSARKAFEFDNSLVDKYIKDEMYNYQNSSKFIAEFITRKIKENR